MTYLWLDGLPIRVETDSTGRPQYLIWKGKKHEIRRILNRWIFHDLWWSKDEEIWRDYYYLTTQSGLMATIFKDNVSGIWYIYRLYD
jgi:hypothetical protein